MCALLPFLSTLKKSFQMHDDVPDLNGLSMCVTKCDTRSVRVTHLHVHFVVQMKYQV